MKTHFGVAITSLLAGALLALVPRPGGAASSGARERDFLTEAASGGQMEVELGRMAATHASSPRVKEFGQRMATDHGKANAELKRVAAKESVKLPDTMTAEHRERVSRLANLQGPEFDRAYMREMVRDHEEDVAKFRETAHSAKDPEIKNFAAKTLSTLEAHLQMAQNVAEASRATSGGRRR